MASEEPPEDYTKLPLDVKLTHKVWRARVSGYEEAAKLFRTLDEDEGYSKFTGLIKKFVIDSNQMAQEKGVEATLAFVENSPTATKITSEVVSGIVAKCLGARPKTKEGSVQVCLMFVEIEQQELVLEELMKGFANKQPKIVAGSIQVITRILQEFGAKVISLKVLMKAVPSLFEHNDKNVRAEAKNLAIELYKWVGAAVKPTLEKNLKPVQMKELEEEWGKLPGTAATPTRLLRSQQQQSQPVGVASGGGGGGGGEVGGGVAAAPPKEIDPYDFAEPEDFMAKLPKDFFEKIADVKWKERKEILEAVLPTSQSIKLVPGDYGEVIKALKKVITKDSNVLVVALAGNVVAGLAKGLRGHFQSYASSILAGIFEKFKEKKMNVVTSLREAADAVYLTTSLVNIQEEVIEALGSKNPSVKSETLLFLCRVFQQCVPSMIPKPLVKAMCPIIIQKLDDTNPAVRETGMECIGTLLRVLGDRPLNAYLESVDKSKMAKIQEHRETVELKIQTGVIPSPMKGQAARPPTPSAMPTESSSPAPDPPKAEPIKKKPKKKAPAAATAESESPGQEVVKKPADKTAVKKDPPTGGAAKPKATKKAPPSSAGGGAKGGKGKGKGGGAVGGIGEPPDPPEPNISNEEVDDKAAAVLPSGLLEQLADTKWKERLEACDKFKSFIEGQSPEEIQSLLYCKVLAKKPGWKDSNFQVMNGKFSVVALLAEKAKVFGRKSMACVMPGLVEKLGDIKIKGTSGEALKVIAERMTLNHVGQQVMKLSFEQKNPKVHSESFEWLGQSIKEFGFLLNIKPFIDYIKKGFGATNPAVRTAAISLLGVIYLYLGAQLRIFFEEEKPALLQQIDATFEKVAGESAPAPTRGPNVRGEEEEEEEEVGGSGSGGVSQASTSLADLMPKVDISGQIKPSLIKELGDKNWKIRGEGLQTVTEILKNAKFIEPQLGDLPGALKARLGDSNKNLVITTLNILSTIASSMGSACARHAKIFIPSIISTFSDMKPQVRVAAVSCLNAWHTELGMVPLVEQEFLTSGLVIENPNLRAELLNWMEEKLPLENKLPSVFSSIVPPLFSCMEDRSGEVRKKAQAALPHIMAHVGYNNMCKQCSKLSTTSKQAIKPLLDKHKASMPSKQSAPPSEEQSKGKGREKVEVKTEPKEEEVEEVTEKPPAKTSDKRGSGTKKGGTKSATRAKDTKKGGAAAEDSGAAFILVPHGKESRNKDEEKLKTLKWNFNQPRKEHVEQLKDQFLTCVNSTLFSQLFHDDFKKHIVALDTMTKSVSGDSSLKEAAIGMVDLLLRWVTLRFFDTNTTVNLKCLEFLKTLFQMLLSEESYRMSDYEANAFLPYLVNKVGDAKEPVRKGVQALFRDICSFYPPIKLFSFVVDGLKSKNARQRAECLEELGVLIQNNGIIVCGSQPQKTIPILAAQISDRDNAVRSAALNTMVIVYGNMGEGIYKFTSQLSDKDISLLEERIRRSGIRPPSSKAEPSNPPPSASTAKSQDQPAERKGAGKSKSSSARTPPPELTSPETESNPIKPEHPVDEPQQEPAVVEPGNVPGPFRMKFDFLKMRKEVNARSEKASEFEKTLGLKMELSKEEAMLLEEPPVEMPRLVSKYMNPSFPVNLSPMRMASTSAAINYIISQIASTDIKTSSTAIKQMEATMINPSQRAAVNSHVDQLIRTVLMQMRVNFSTPLSKAEDQETLQEVMQLGKLLTSCLFTLFSEASLAEQASRDSLIEVEQDIIGYLVDERLLKLEEAPQFIRSFNCLMLRVCENTNKTAIFCSLIHVLLKSITSDGKATKITELTMKCLWKLTRQIPQIVSDINLDQLLLEIHQFIVGYLTLVPAPSPEDTPFRTVKTVLFHTTSTVGTQILDHLSLIKDANRSKVTSYIRKNLAKKQASVEEGSLKSSSSHVNESERRHGKLAKVTKVLSFLPPGSSSVLSDIFLKIGEAKTTKEGLTRLYKFKQDHPSFDLDLVLSDQTKFYRDYITRGLKAIKEDQSLRTDYDEQVEALEEMRQSLSRTFGISMEELTSDSQDDSSRTSRSSIDGNTRTSKSDENKPLNLPPRHRGPVTSKPHAQQVPSSSGSIGRGGPSSSFDLADLRRRLDKLKGTA